MSDLISRRAAIEAVINLTDIFVNNLPPMKYATDVQDAINGVPPAQRWIPCSERLPEYGVESLTINKDDEYEINHIIDEDDGEWFYDGVIAWMPLPEPYGDDI